MHEDGPADDTVLPNPEFTTTHWSVSVGAVKMAVLRMRRRYGEMLRAEIARSVSGPEEIDDEIRYLCAVIGS